MRHAYPELFGSIFEEDDVDKEFDFGTTTDEAVPL